MTDFFGDPLVWPAVVYCLGYSFVWIIACGLGHLFKNRVSIERAAAIAWGIALFIHILGGTALIIWLWERAHNRFSEGVYAILYLLFYMVIMLVNVCLLYTLLRKNKEKRNTDTPTPKPVGKSLNPKKSDGN